jgi:WD40 repeat protein
MSRANVEDRSVVGVPLPSPDEILYSVAFSPDRKLLAIGGVGGVFLWNLEKVPKGS